MTGSLGTGAVMRAVLAQLSVCGFDVFPRPDAGAAVPRDLRHLLTASADGQSQLWGIQRHTGRHLEVTCVLQGRTPTRPQTAWLAQMRASGAVAFWADSAAMAQAKLQAAMMDTDHLHEAPE